MRPNQRGVISDRSELFVAARSRAIGFRMPMCLGRVTLVMLEVISTKGMYGILLPMNSSVQKNKLTYFLLTAYNNF